MGAYGHGGRAGNAGGRYGLRREEVPDSQSDCMKGRHSCDQTVGGSGCPPAHQRCSTGHRSTGPEWWGNFRRGHGNCWDSETNRRRWARQ